MPVNDFLPFAQGVSANVELQATYVGDAQRIDGNQPGVARSALVNKALRQATAIAAAIADIIAAGQNQDVTDDLTPATLAAMFLRSVGGVNQAAQTLYVSTAGNDATNDGSIGSPFRTWQHAANVAAAYNAALYGVSVTIADGNYAEDVFVSVAAVPQVSGYGIEFVGNTGAPANVTVQSLYFYGTGLGRLRGAKTSQDLTIESGRVNMDHVVINTARLFVLNNAVCVADTLTFSGNADAAIFVRQSAICTILASTITVTGTPAYGTAFAVAQDSGVLWFHPSVVFAGGATGVRYLVTGNAVINVSGSGATYLPGDAGGVASTGGQYN